jgi:hypothetical protein
MLKMQKTPNLLLLVVKDDQLAYFTMLTPISTINCHDPQKHSQTLLHI